MSVLIVMRLADMLALNLNAFQHEAYEKTTSARTWYGKGGDQRTKLADLNTRLHGLEERLCVGELHR
jgi:hypothetical protein